MNPHELIKHSFDSAEPSEDFTARVVEAAGVSAKPNKQPRLPRIALIAAVLVIVLAITAAAAGILTNWLTGVVQIADETALESATIGDVLLEQDVDGMHVRYGQFLCVGRFLYMEIEITKDDGTDVTEENLYDVSFDSMHAYGLTMDYEKPYVHGIYQAEGEGFSGYHWRQDDGSTPGYARYTLSWTLQRHDYAGNALHIQIWEPYEWVTTGSNGEQTALNGRTRKLLAETIIERKTPPDEQVYHLENGDEVRICSFGAEIQGREYLEAADAFMKQAAAEGQISGLWTNCGIVLSDGTRVSFNPNVDGVFWGELPSSDHWSAAPFSATVDPTQVTALYLGDTLLSLLP